MSHAQEMFDRAVAAIRNAKELAVFTGAGISAESGIPTFRDEGGLWRDFPPEEFATWQGLSKAALLQPRKLAQFLIAVLEPVANAAPNPAHDAIARLQNVVPTTVITQNVDHLHQDAGSRTVYEVHGSFFRIYHGEGKPMTSISRDQMQEIVLSLKKVEATGILKLPRLLSAVSPMLGLQGIGIRRPNLVLFGDAMAEPDWTSAQRIAEQCDVMIVVGTSGLVWPAATLPAMVATRSGTVITIDPEESGHGNLWLQATAGDILPNLVNKVISVDNSL